jgi:hypothetical protein
MMTGHSADSLTATFNQLFIGSENTRLEGGGAEPFYHPPEGERAARVVFRDDYVSSALHEISHWCIAGAERRLLPDFGYWYEPDGRNEAQQKIFEQVEIKPQAVEWALSLAGGIKFNFSADNLANGGVVSDTFKRAVWQQCVSYLNHGLPPRAQRLFDALRDGREIKAPEAPC